MKKRLTRIHKTIIAEVYTEREIDGKVYETLVDSKEFNYFKGMVLNIEPTDKTYEDATKWANRVIYLHLKHTHFNN